MKLQEIKERKIKIRSIYWQNKDFYIVQKSGKHLIFKNAALHPELKFKENKNKNINVSILQINSDSIIEED